MGTCDTRVFVEHCGLLHNIKMRSSFTPAIFALSLLSSARAIGPDCISGPLASNKICDKNASPPERAAALVAAMEDQEKLDNLMRYRIPSE